jgi:hypothetical protein
LSQEDDLRKALIAAALGLGLAALVPLPVPTLGSGAAQTMPDFYGRRDVIAKQRIRELERTEEGLRRDRARLALCAATGCLTPTEAALLAFSKGPDERTAGRFILDVQAGTGPRNPNQLHSEELFYLSSYRRFGEFGTLVVAIEPEGLRGLIRASGGDADKDPSVSRMMKLFAGKRVIVDGEVGLQWIEFRDWETGQRSGRGYHQVWVRVTSPDQIEVIGPA